MNYFKIMKESCLKVNMDFDIEKYNKFMKYKDLLQSWNKKINLTSIKEDEEIIKKHFIDCISIFKFSPIKSMINFIDVGSGAGFPGIPISIIKPDTNIVLLDSLAKRVNFLNCVINTLNLKGVSEIHGRAEDMAREIQYREFFDVAVSRAVGNLSMLSELCIPYVKLGGYFIAMKGPSVIREVEDSNNAISILGGKLENVVKIQDKELNHNLVIIKKIGYTPLKYPRRAGVVSKKPLK